MIKDYYFSLPSGGASGVPCQFAARSGVSGNSSSSTETDNITGAAGALVTIQVTTYTITNSSGQAKVNGSPVFLNNTFTITLDGSGHGSFVTNLSGNPADTGSVVRVVFTITSVSIGQLGTPVTQEVSKIF